ncbi:ammonium transporter [Clydaea vesicula]|uniref:Extracellular metalloproteinase n=1 Tax=Clydaea vesicula TaxID=447962 RepID=A0AAD5UAX7_9FUNG|nr:ammonium transporter [Clydaea vesicula]KAJ3397652.1 ammonium transporter [Lobulomyces angularis]
MKSSSILSIASIVLSVATSPLTGNPTATKEMLPGYFNPEASFEVYDVGNNAARTPKSAEQKQQLAHDHLVGVVSGRFAKGQAPDVVLTSTVESIGDVTTFHYAPAVDGIQVVNAAANVNIDNSGNVIGTGASWLKTGLTVKKGDKFSAIDALKSLLTKLGLTFDPTKFVETKTAEGTKISGLNDFGDVIISVKYYRTEDTLEKVFDIALPLKDHYYNGFVEMNEGKVIGLNDWMVHEHDVEFRHDAGRAPGKSFLKKRVDYKYNVVGFPHEDLSEGRVILTNPADKVASPLGWHNNGSGDQPTTIGNNVQAQDTQQNTPRRVTKPDYNFDYPIDETKDAKTYWEAGLVNTFYVTNAVHDITYQYGFDEKSGNFQTNNFDKGGKGNDHIIGNSQDGGGTNNANFATPPDGQSGRMNMYLFTQSTPNRDGDLDNCVVTHEIMHGISNRLTGGPSNVNCLGTTQAGGMGEGWSDVNSYVLTAKATDTRDTDRAVGAYVMNKPTGVRQYAYSTDKSRNPLLYSSIKSSSAVHFIGTVWGTILFEVYWNMVDKSGFSTDILHDAASGKGNTDFFQFLLNGMKLQPCSPTFITARDAFILADKNAGGKYHCDIWKGFAKRGLGANAANMVDNYDLPEACGGPQPSPSPTTTTSPGACAHDKCTTGSALVATCDTCVGKICDADPYCCSNSWDSICVKAVKSVCNITC